MELLKMLDPGLVIAHMACFFIVLFVLSKFMWKPVFATLEMRRKRIEDEQKAIDATRSDVARLKADYELFLSKVDEKARERIKEADHQGEVQARAIREKAREEAERIVEDSRREIAFEFAKTRESLRGEVVNMVITVTEKMLQEKLTFDSDRRIVEQMLSEINKK